jgi:hypothetical protein
MSDQDPPAPPDPNGEPTQVDTPVSDPTMAMPATAASTPGGPPSEPPGPDEPEAPPPDRRPWVIIGLLIVLLLVGLALLFLDDDDDESASTTTSTTTSSTTTSSTTSTTAPTTTAPPTTTTAPPTTIDPARCVSSEPDDPDITAGVVFDAYTVGDRDCASNLMTADALEELFAIQGAGGGWTFMGCEEVPDPEQEPTLCGFRFEGGSTSFHMQYDAGWIVFDVSQNAD